MYDWVLAGPYLRISAAGVHISCVQAVLGVPPCGVVVGKESLSDVRERKGHWGRERFFALVKAVVSVPRIVGALECDVDMCGAAMS